eukprot:Nitzschia sp. Nitz4//scaffold247_size31676//13675//17524//NITZ4_007929-RA/size31676-processed-gene-0.19-mRNA-1//-1//CDS//3329543952//6697//frame0
MSSKLTTPKKKKDKSLPPTSNSSSKRMKEFSAQHGVAPGRIGNNSHTGRMTPNTAAAEEDHPDLAELEQRLTHEVDDDFFQDPRKFHTLHRVIDVLGMQLDTSAMDALQDTAASRNYRDLNSNPAYKTLKDQQQVVEEAIEHLALIHCADLNGSVVQVGRVARQFHDAVTQVRHLRKQVQEIQETLGAGTEPANNHANNNNKNGQQQPSQPNSASAATPVAAQSNSQAAAMSLRELWLKKLEAEAVLSLLDKLDRIRAAPRQFDRLVEQNRIGSAVSTVAQALDTMFSSDVAQVQALHKIMEQLMLRKQRAEEVVWDLLLDVLFLRTGNGTAERIAQQSKALLANMAAAGGGAPAPSNTATNPATADRHPYGIVNPFLTPQLRYALPSDLQYEPTALASTKASELSAAVAAATLDWQDEFVTDEETKGEMLIPTPNLDADFDLESEERRHLEEQSYAWNDQNANQESKLSPTKPSYGDHVLALRTLVECLVRLRRLDDVERFVTDALEKEIHSLVEREQTRTFMRVENSSNQQLSSVGRYAMLLNKAGASTDLRDFRKHLLAVVSAFGNVWVRLGHLAQIIRHRLASEKKYSAAYAVPSAALASTLRTAKDVMERELKSFLDACLHGTLEKEPEFNISALTNVSGQSRQVATKTTKKKINKLGLESGLFSLGIIDTNDKDSAPDTWMPSTTTSRRNAIQELSTSKFVNEVLFAKTTQNGTPQIRHALFFRKALAKWHIDSAAVRSQLARATLEDTSAPSYATVDETPALEYLDIVIQRDLLPVLQEEAVNGTVRALERPDAFDPVLDRSVYARTDSNEPQDVDMCRACTALYNFTGPLFLALHRLPKGGDMYLPLVAVLEHVILTFISRVKQQVSRLCADKTAFALLLDATPSGSSQVAFATIMERRKAYAQLVLAYADGDLLEAAAMSDPSGDGSGVPLLTPSASDTPNKAQQQSKLAAIAGMEDLDLVGGVEREESNLSNELAYVKAYLEFAAMDQSKNIKTCPDEHLMKSACLSHSLLKLASLLDSRLKVRSAVGGISTKTLTNTRALREAIKTIKANGLKMAKFCRADVLLQSVTRLSKVCHSSTVVARDAVRIPSSVNDLGEYMTAASDNLREAAGNAVTAYAFSTLEQYIPLCLIQTVRVLAAGKGIVTKAPLTMNGIEALDRSGSVLYRDLKGATSFDNSFWDIELAAVSFERSASFIAMMELEMAELEAYYQENRSDFSEQDFQLMFSMNGPRRKGDIGRYHLLVKRLDKGG